MYKKCLYLQWANILIWANKAVGMAMAVEAMPDPTSMITAQKMTNTSKQDAVQWNEGAT